MRLLLAQILAGILFGPPIAVSHLFWWFWGMNGWWLGLLAGQERQVRIWHTLQIGPTYSSTLLGPLWSYFGHEPEHRKSAVAIPVGGHISKCIMLSAVDHEHDAFTFMRTSTDPIYGMGGAESRELVHHD